MADSEMIFLDSLTKAEEQAEKQLLAVSKVSNLKMNRRDTFGPPSNVNCRTPSAKN